MFKSTIMKASGMALIAVGLAASCFATVPEIDAASGTNAIALIAGALLVIRSRRK